MKKIVLATTFLLVIFASFFVWSRIFVKKDTISIKNNQIIKEKVVVEDSAFELFSTKEKVFVLITTRSYMRGSGNGIIALSVNGKVRNSSDTVVINDETISTYTLGTIRDLNFGTNQVELISWVDGEGELIVASVDISLIK